MVKFVQILIFLCFLIGWANAQSPVSLSLTTFEYVICENKEYHKYEINVINNTDQPIDFWWELVKDENFDPMTWATTVCDEHLCYFDNFDKCPPDKKNTLPPNGSIPMEVKFFPKGNKGSTKMYLKLYSDVNYQNVLVQTDPEGKVVVDCSLTSTKNINVEETLKIFPNPTSNYFSIANDNDVSKVSLFNVVGKEVRTSNHFPGMSHDVSGLPKGIYLVKIYDRFGKNLKTVRLSKR